MSINYDTHLNFQSVLEELSFNYIVKDELIDDKNLETFSDNDSFYTYDYFLVRSKFFELEFLNQKI
jgi:hypothetical protein